MEGKNEVVVPAVAAHQETIHDQINTKLYYVY